MMIIGLFRVCSYLIFCGIDTLQLVTIPPPRRGLKMLNGNPPPDKQIIYIYTHTPSIHLLVW
jgi:hypothetical protein